MQATLSLSVAVAVSVLFDVKLELQAVDFVRLRATTGQSQSCPNSPSHHYYFTMELLG